MAYRIPNKTPVDQSARTAVGISLPFTTLFKSTYTTQEATRFNLINYILTNKGERPLNPAFGSDLRAKLFEPLTEETFGGIEVQLKEEIAFYFPLIEVKNLVVSPLIDQNAVTVKLVYSILGNTPDEVNITVNDVGEVSSSPTLNTGGSGGGGGSY